MENKWILFSAYALFTVSSLAYAEPSFHQAPAATRLLKNPYQPGDKAAIQAGTALYMTHCASCHGNSAMGSGNIPSLAKGPAQGAADSEVFWFIGHGSPQNGMPPSGLSGTQNWQIVSFIKSLKNAPFKAPSNMQTSSLTAAQQTNAPPPPPPFTDYRYEKPGQFHKITLQDLPSPEPATSVGNGPQIVKRPANAWPKVPAGFYVQLYATGLDNPRLLRTAPNGDIFLAESSSGKIRVFRGITSEGKPIQAEVFTSGLNRPYGIAFYPLGKNPQWIYIANTDSVVRFPYKSGDLHAQGTPQIIAALPHGPTGHWTRDIQFSLDGKQMFVSVGSAANIDDADNVPAKRIAPIFWS